VAKIPLCNDDRKNRSLQENIQADLEEKMVFLSGPRQVGKTTLAKTFLKTQEDLYYNWDRREDRKSILAAQWPAVRSTIVLDELHKYRRWKNCMHRSLRLSLEKASLRRLITVCPSM
jgi:predicted AAA+ superfamily ATPase